MLMGTASFCYGGGDPLKNKKKKKKIEGTSSLCQRHFFLFVLLLRWANDDVGADRELVGWLGEGENDFCETKHRAIHRTHKALDDNRSRTPWCDVLLSFLFSSHPLSTQPLTRVRKNTSSNYLVGIDNNFPDQQTSLQVHRQQHDQSMGSLRPVLKLPDDSCSVIRCSFLAKLPQT